MPAMPLEARIVVGFIIVLLIGAIAAYHVWIDRREAARESASSLASTGLRAAPPRPTAERTPAAPAAGAPPRAPSARRTQ
jgi:hypothetical protein